MSSGQPRQARTIRTLLAYGVDLFETARISYGHGTTNALDEAAWLILRALDLPPTDLDAHLDQSLTSAQYAAAKSLLERRVATREPAAYLLNEAWLGSYRFYVDSRVIVPRSFIAELLLDRKRGQIPFSGPPSQKRNLTPFSVLDLCTGSGCLAILAALRYPEARVDAVDLSADALDVARRNVADYGLGSRVRLVRSDLYSALDGNQYDLILSNPPYVNAASMRALPQEYRKEPRMALASGIDGLRHTRAILEGAHAHLSAEGLLVVEIGHNRAALEKAYPGAAFQWPRTAAGRGHVFSIRRSRLPRSTRDPML